MEFGRANKFKLLRRNTAMEVLISVSDKTGLVEFAGKLDGEVISTDGTARFLEENGIKITTTSELTGFEERRELKTLHHVIYEDVFSGKIGMVVVNLYPFEDEPSIDNIDIGGVSLLRAAAKNYSKVLPVCNPGRYQEVLRRMDNNDLTEEFRRELALEAFEYVAKYDTAIAEWFKEQSV